MAREIFLKNIFCFVSRREKDLCLLKIEVLSGSLLLINVCWLLGFPQGCSRLADRKVPEL